MEQDNYEDLITIPTGTTEECLIKVMGVGGGGCNAVNYLYRQGVEGVSFLVCNTDRQQLTHSAVPAHLQLGPGWGAGGKPETARDYAEKSKDAIRDALNDGTQMLFITAGQGGGTGTGASPVVAEVAREMGILTVAIVTIPFAFEGQPKIRKALDGISQLQEQVDAILVIDNEKLRAIYSDLDTLNAFAKADDVLANAARSIAEIITVQGIINTDFADVYNTLKDGHAAIMSVGRASGDQRITAAIEEALNSPLANSNDVRGAKRILLQLYCSTEHAIKMDEYSQVHRFVDRVGQEVEVQWGISLDESLGEEVRITIIATGYTEQYNPLREIERRPEEDSHDEEPSHVEPETHNDDEQSIEIDLTKSVPDNNQGQIEINFEEPAEEPVKEEPRREEPTTPSSSSKLRFPWMR